MLIGIDHLVIAVADPDEAASTLESSLGLTAGGGGRHSALGTFNRLVWLGDTYLELIGVFDKKLAAASWIGAPAGRAIAAGGGFATWAVASDDLPKDVAALRERGSDLSDPIPGERVRPDGRVVRWRLAAAPQLDPELPPFLIEHDASSAEWTRADQSARQDGPVRLTTLETAVSDVSVTIGQYLRTTGLRFRPSLAGQGARETAIGGQSVRIRPRHDPGAPAVTVHLAMTGASGEADLLGCHWIVRAR